MTEEQKQAAWRAYVESDYGDEVLTETQIAVKNWRLSKPDPNFFAGLSHGEAERERLETEAASMAKVYECLSDYIFGTYSAEFAEVNDGIDALRAKLRKEMDRHEDEHMTVDCRDIAT